MKKKITYSFLGIVMITTISLSGYNQFSSVCNSNEDYALFKIGQLNTAVAESSSSNCTYQKHTRCCQRRRQAFR